MLAIHCATMVQANRGSQLGGGYALANPGAAATGLLGVAASPARVLTIAEYGVASKLRSMF
jgi:hypothetical protein